MLCLERCFIWLRNLDTKKIGEEIFEELRNLVLAENGEDKMVRESSNEDVLQCIREQRAPLKISYVEKPI